jgi:DNA polymerase III subunit delta'
LLPTIKSRVQLFNVPPHTDAEIQTYLTEKLAADPAKARQVSRLAGGSLGKAMGELESMGDVAYQSFQSWMRLCLGRDYSKLIALSEDFAKSPKPEQRNTLEFGLTLVRESILSQSGDESLISREGEEKEFIVKFGNAIPLSGLEGVYIKLSEALGHLARNASPKITFMSLSLSISEHLAKRNA